MLAGGRIWRQPRGTRSAEAAHSFAILSRPAVAQFQPSASTSALGCRVFRALAAISSTLAFLLMKTRVYPAIGGSPVSSRAYFDLRG